MLPAHLDDVAQSVVSEVARRVRPAVERYGWDVEDCQQQAALELLVLRRDGIAPDEDYPSHVYLIVCLKRAVYRAAKPAHYVPTVQQQIDERVVYLGREDAQAELKDLIDSAPYLVRLYLRAIVWDGIDWAAMCARHGWSNRVAAKARRHAELWLGDQYAGRPAGADREDTIREVECTDARSMVA